MHSISLKLKKRLNQSHSILIEPGLFKKIPKDLQKNDWANRYCIITDTNGKKYYGEELRDEMRKIGLDATLISFQSGEHQKNLKTIDHLLTQMVQLGHTRKSMVIGLGGGVVGDIAGFVASIYMRGIPLVHIPTTLIAMGDSSMGGKTGVDLLIGKNLAGTFHQPKRIYIDPQLVSTLPKKQIRIGLAEIVKHGLIADKKILKILSKTPEKILEGHITTLTKLLERSCRVKAKIICKDTHETEMRMILNYGHTIGHAIEHASGYRLSHGEAISIGMNLENQIAVNRKLMKVKHAERIETLLKNLKLPTRIPENIDRNPILEAIKHDKKNSTTQIYTMALIKRPGKPIIKRDITEQEIKSIL